VDNNNGLSTIKEEFLGGSSVHLQKENSARQHSIDMGSHQVLADPDKKKEVY